MLQRTISGIIYVALIMISLFAGKFTFAIVMLLFGVLALYEFYRIAAGTGTDFMVISGIVTGALMILSVFFVSSSILSPAWLSVGLLLIVLLLAAGLFASRDGRPVRIAIVVMGVLYIALPLSLLIRMTFPASLGHSYTPWIVMGIFILIWINDIMAYLVGITLGRHRLFERVSPKKSWEGAIGGTVFTIASAIWMDNLTHVLTQKQWIFLAGIVSVFGVLGDLFESMFKRSADLKDSGRIIPGHGGILDRIDSMLFVAPVAFVYLLFQNF